MIWAIKNDERIHAKPKQKAICPLCGEKVISKCGEIKIWHWAHKKDFVCDSFGEGETEWHLKWKNYFSQKLQEITIRKKISLFSPYEQGFEIHKHRADVKTKEGIILEFQNSPLSVKEIKKREEFYGYNLIWIINKKTLAKNFYWINKNKRYFWWNYVKSWKKAQNRIYIDLENSLYLIYSFPIGKIRGTGRLISKEAFIIEHGGNPFK